MPYKTPEEVKDKVPGVSKLSDKRARQFMHVFNSCFEKDGDNDKCYAMAWGAVKKSESDDKEASIAYSTANKVDAKKEGAATLKRWDDGFLSAGDAVIFGDQRYSYISFRHLSITDQAQARRQYPNKNVGAKYDFSDEHYYYPVDKNGQLAKARRVLAIPKKMIEDDKAMKELGYTVKPSWKGASRISSKAIARIAFKITFAGQEHMTPDEVGVVCPKCARAIRAKGLKWVKTAVVHDSLFKSICSSDLRVHCKSCDWEGVYDKADAPRTCPNCGSSKLTKRVE